MQVHLGNMASGRGWELPHPQEITGESSNSIVKGRKRTQLLLSRVCMCYERSGSHGAPQESSSMVRSCRSTWSYSYCQCCWHPKTEMWQ